MKSRNYKGLDREVFDTFVTDSDLVCNITNTGSWHKTAALTVVLS